MNFGSQYACAERMTGNGYESRCSVCLAWHKQNYGFEFDYTIQGSGGRMRKSLCPKCVKIYKYAIDKAWMILDEISNEQEGGE